MIASANIIVVLWSLSLTIAHEFFVQKEDFSYKQPEIGFEINICYASNPKMACILNG
jgi:hypothetical protein